MQKSNVHKFHIPVLGIGFSVDAPLKVAKYGISSVISLVDDTLMEKLRKHYDTLHYRPHIAIEDKEEDARALRITAYLNMIHHAVKEQFEKLKNSSFENGSEIHKYFEMLPDFSLLKIKYAEMHKAGDEKIKSKLREWLRENMRPGSIDVNIMTKLDKANYGKSGEQMGVEFNDAHASLRGYAQSELESSIVFSAGMNSRLYSYMESFRDFFPSADGSIKKRIIIKVSDFRSALIQGKFLAKKGLWVSEFRIESGLNCGGHAFATDGYLLGPILEEFRLRREELNVSLKELLRQALQKKGIEYNEENLETRVTVQGGVGTSGEQNFLLKHYGVDSVGWGSPFLLVPEVMNVDEKTLEKLSVAGEKDFYLSDVSPLGVQFNNIRTSEKDEEKQERVERGKPGSPCPKKYLQFNTEFSDKPLCTASITYLNKKIQNLRDVHNDAEEFSREFDKAVDKACLCEGLVASALIVNNIETPKQSRAVAVCPGPNLAYFSKVVTLKEMADHIYGRINLVTDPERPNLFIKELGLYVDYLGKKINGAVKPLSGQMEEFIRNFTANLTEGIEYYRGLIPAIPEEAGIIHEKMLEELNNLEQRALSYSFVAV